MDIAHFLSVKDIPIRKATEIKTKWKEVVRHVKSAGSVAITNHSEVEVVLLSANLYSNILDELKRLDVKDSNVLTELKDRFNQRLESLQSPDSVEKVTALFTSPKKNTSTSKVGEAY